MDKHPFFATISGFSTTAVGTVSTFIVTYPGQVISVIVSVIAGIYTIRAAKKVLQVKQAQVMAAQAEEARQVAKLCMDCRKGLHPSHCPIHPENRPEDCPLGKK